MLNRPFSDVIVATETKALYFPIWSHDMIMIIFCPVSITQEQLPLEGGKGVGEKRVWVIGGFLVCCQH